MNYACKIIDGTHVAVVEDEDGTILSISPPCDSKFHAMGVRDQGRNEGKIVPEGWRATELARFPSEHHLDAPTPYTMEPRAMQEAIALPSPEKFAAMSWPEKRKLAASISNRPIRSRADAEAVYKYEVEQRKLHGA